jgi:hypothetical protein
MTLPAFEELVVRLEDSLAHQKTQMRNCILQGQMLAVTVRYYEFINITS